MFERIFPRQFDNVYRGYRVGLWLFVPILLLELTIGFNSMVATRLVATTADGIPLDRFGGGGAEMVISLFALMGLCRFLLALQGVLVLVRYRAMIPIMYLLFLMLHLGTKALDMLHPTASTGAASSQKGSLVIVSIIAMLLVGFVLSILRIGSPNRSLTQGARP